MSVIQTILNRESNWISAHKARNVGDFSLVKLCDYLSGTAPSEEQIFYPKDLGCSAWTVRSKA